jgi:hypothetical protein
VAVKQSGTLTLVPRELSGSRSRVNVEHARIHHRIRQAVDRHPINDWARMAGIKVFVSVGRTSTPEQEAFVTAIEAHMLAHGLTPQALGRNYWSSQQPLRAIDELMTECSGVAIVGFERLRIVQAIDRRGSSTERQVTDVALPTVWNQIEAAMAYTRGLPLLVLVQEELRAEGLLETGYDWYVKRMAFETGIASDREFHGIFDDWRTRVETHHGRKSARPPASVADVKTGSSPTTEARAEGTAIEEDRASEALYRAFLSAFQTEGALERMLRFGMRLNLAELATGNLADQVFAVVKFAEARGLVDRLLQAGIQANPGNADLRALAETRSVARPDSPDAPRGTDS